MPAYDFRCENCAEQFTRLYKSISAYADATPTCPNCESTDLKRVINKVNVAAPTRDYTKMDANEMLSVFESGDSKQVGKMFDQIGGTNPALGTEYHEATKRLLKGESMDNVESSLQQRQDSKKAPDSTSSDD
ncbi:MAG: zinc ribbon domain-containing protein [Chloroflexota bacterium]